MIAQVVKLPTASSSFYTVRKSSNGWWVVELVTPSPKKPLRTPLVSFADRDDALREGRETAQRTLRPFKEPRATR